MDALYLRAPQGPGLLGLVEPCSVGANVIGAVFVLLDATSSTPPRPTLTTAVADVGGYA